MSTEPEEGATPGTAVGVVEDGAAGSGSPVDVGRDGDGDGDGDGAASGSEGGSVGGGPLGAARAANPLVLAGVVLVVVAAICAGVFGWLWASAANSDSAGFARTRDDVLHAAEVGTANLTSIDYRNVQRDLDRWQQSATSDLYKQLTQGTSTLPQKVTKAKATITGVVRQAAVTELDPHAGKASVIMVVDVTVSPAGGKAQSNRLPLQAALITVNGAWKLSALGQVSTGTPGQ